VNGSTKEKALTLALAKALERGLHERLPHAQVVLTRERDEAMTVAARVQAANAAGGHLFLSLHANASPDHTLHGYETYLLDLREQSLETAYLAWRKNDDASAEPGRADEVSIAVRELTLAAHREYAARFARSLHQEQAKRFPKRLDRGVKQGRFDVLMGVRMPAVLFEVGFLDHAVEGTFLMDATTQRVIVDGLVQAIAQYYREVVLPG